jgi:hypothetical protein
MTFRLLRRETLRRAAEKLNTTTGPGREEVLAPILAEVTTEAASRVSAIFLARRFRAGQTGPCRRRGDRRGHPGGRLGHTKR